MKRTDKAISETVGTLLLLGIAISLFSVIYFSVVTIYPISTHPSVNLICSNEENDIIIEHRGGKTLDLDTKFIVTMAQTSESFTAFEALDNESKSNGLWNMGEKIVYNLVSIKNKIISLHNDNVDSNSCDIDNSSDKGIETNFANCQDVVPDTKVMTIKEIKNDNAVYDNSVYSNSCDVDSIADKGTETNFVNCQDIVRDTNVMTLQEVNQGGNATPTVKIESSASWGVNAQQLSQSYTHPSGLSDDVLYVGVMTTGGKTCSNVTYNGVPLSLMTSRIPSAGMPYNYVYYTTTPATGNNTLVVNLQASDNMAVIALSLSGVYNATPHNFTSIDGKSSTISHVISSATGAMVFDFAGNVASGAMTVGAGQTQICQQDTAGYYCGISNESGAASVTMSWGIPQSKDWATILWSCNPTTAIDYELDMEYQFNNANFNCDNEKVCLYLTGSVTESLLVDYYNSGWVNLGTINSAGWSNFTATGLSSSNYNIRIRDQNQSIEATQHSWTVDCLFLHCWNDTNYKIDFEYQWTGANFTEENEKLCMYITSHTGTETLNIKYWNGGWINLGSITGTGWVNVTATGLNGSNYTIQLIGASETADTTQDSWSIDCMFLYTYNTDNEEDEEISVYVIDVHSNSVIMNTDLYV